MPYRFVTSVALAAAAAAILASSAAAQTKWNLPSPYPVDNPHTVNLAAFAKDVADGGTRRRPRIASSLRSNREPGATATSAPSSRSSAGPATRTTYGASSAQPSCFARARMLLEGFAQLEHELNERLAEPRGLLRVCSSLGFGRAWVAPALARFQALHPGVELYKIQMLGLPREAEALILGGNAKRLIFGPRFGRKLRSVTKRARISGALRGGRADPSYW